MVSYRIFWWGKGRSLWGTDTASCMSMRLSFEYETVQIFKFSGGGGVIPGPPLYETLECFQGLKTIGILGSKAHY